MVTVQVCPEVESQPDQPAKVLPALEGCGERDNGSARVSPVQVPPFWVQLHSPWHRTRIWPGWQPHQDRRVVSGINPGHQRYTTVNHGRALGQVSA